MINLVLPPLDLTRRRYRCINGEVEDSELDQTITYSGSLIGRCLRSVDILLVVGDGSTQSCHNGTMRHIFENRGGMTKDQSSETEHETRPSSEISQEDQRAVDEKGSESAKVIHEVVRLQGDEELSRPIRSLLFSGFAAGLAINASVIAEAAIYMRLPNAPWRELVMAVGYSVGFVIVILGKMQLFTENTVTAVLPVITHPTRRNLGRLLRLWIAVFLANMAGTLLIAFLMSKRVIVGEDMFGAILEVSRSVQGHGPKETLLLATPAGFLIAAIAWILPNARGNELWIILLITWVISIGGFSHVVAGSSEAWLLMFQGDVTIWQAINSMILPALLGNIIGGTGLFAFVAHGQVRDEIKP